MTMLVGGAARPCIYIPDIHIQRRRAGSEFFYSNSRFSFSACFLFFLLLFSVCFSSLLFSLFPPFSLSHFKFSYLYFFQLFNIAYTLSVCPTVWMFLRSFYPFRIPPIRHSFARSTLGVVTFIVILFGSNLIKHLGWRAGALATPISMAALAAPLFAVVIASKVKERRSLGQTFSNPNFDLGEMGHDILQVDCEGRSLPLAHPTSQEYGSSRCDRERMQYPFAKYRWPFRAYILFLTYPCRI